jgi:hypothetical protein
MDVVERLIDVERDRPPFQRDHIVLNLRRRTSPGLLQRLALRLALSSQETLSEEVQPAGFATRAAGVRRGGVDDTSGLDRPPASAPTGSRRCAVNGIAAAAGAEIRAVTVAVDAL